MPRAGIAFSRNRKAAAPLFSTGAQAVTGQAICAAAPRRGRPIARASCALPFASRSPAEKRNFGKSTRSPRPSAAAGSPRSRPDADASAAHEPYFPGVFAPRSFTNCSLRRSRCGVNAEGSIMRGATKHANPADANCPPPNGGHGPVDASRAIADTAGHPSRPYRAIDTLAIMERRGSITDRDAACRRGFSGAVCNCATRPAAGLDCRRSASENADRANGEARPAYRGGARPQYGERSRPSVGSALRRDPVSGTSLVGSAR